MNLVQLVNMPEMFGKYKVVQLYLDDNPYLVFGDVGGAHYKILGDFLNSHGIEPELTTLPQMPSKIFPTLTGDRYEVAGMGSSEVHPEEMVFYMPKDLSFVYDFPISEEFNELLKELPDWTVR